MSNVSGTRSFKRDVRAARPTPNAVAAPDIERPRGPITSLRIKPPGCGGFFMRVYMGFQTQW
jgi:hypothetical protein